MTSLHNFAPMDEQTFRFLTECIDTAPNLDSLEGIRVTVEWFYDMDKDFKAFDYLINLISEKQKTL